ncbi:UNVERIFIED_CONTAM: Calcium-binding protein CBP [Sesamum latifolium]|uniref:Calcium-binding protein CBP n=1 Tax=Sesamum latifolium TaxID=2727402 RepID=A0AAW2XHB0_9LAMI
MSNYPHHNPSGYPYGAPPPSSQSYPPPPTALRLRVHILPTNPHLTPRFPLLIRLPQLPPVDRSLTVADSDGSGFIDDKELQRALSSYNQSFGLRTVHLLMYLFTNSNVRKIGPKEFTQVFYSLQNWRDRSGKIDASELRDALLSLGFSVSPVILDLLVSKFDKSGGKNKAIEYDNFIECCLTVKGLTEKFKEKDTAFSGSATFTYESFMLTVLPFLIA